MAQLALPLVGVDTVDTLRAQNITLKIQNHAQENELLEVKHALDLAISRGGTIHGSAKQRVVLHQPSNVLPNIKYESQIRPSQPRHNKENEKILFDEEMVDMLQGQLKEKAEELSKATDDLRSVYLQLDDLKQKYLELQQKSTTAQAPTSSHQHLFGQIRFLHGEVERLEKVLAHVRDDSVEEIQQATDTHMRAMLDKDVQLKDLQEQLRTAVSGRPLIDRKAVGVDELSSRCRSLETQLAAALSEKAVLSTERYELLAKVRKLEQSVKDKKSTIHDVQKVASVEQDHSSTQLRALHDVITALANEKEYLSKELLELRSRLNAPRMSSWSQCEPVQALNVSSWTDPPPSSSFASCQVDTVRHFADIGRDSVESVTHLLSLKCSELDTISLEYEQLKASHQESVTFIEAIKKRLSEEMERRSILSGEVEKVTLQMRAMQQQASQKQSQCRELQMTLEASEKRMQAAVSTALQLEHERQQWQEELGNHSHDMHNLVTNQNVVNNQLSQVMSENDALRGEVQKLLHREAQCNYTIRAKDSELGEVLVAYQAAVKEAEARVSSCRAIERESDNLKAAIASKEERIVHLEEQISQLHAREQQLNIDLQAFDYEGGQLHRKASQFELIIAHLEAQIYESRQTVAACERINQELERNATELSKQLVLRDSECMHLRNRCDSVEHEFSALQVAHMTESQRLRQLEEHNARVVVRGILASRQESEMRDSAADGVHRELQQLKAILRQTTDSLSLANRQLELEQSKQNESETKLSVAQCELNAAHQAQQRLHNLLLEQASTLSKLSN